MSDLHLEHNEDKNIVKKLSKSQQEALAQQTASLWQNYTTQIQPLLDESEENWKLYCDYKPTMAWKVDNKATKTKGVKLSQVPKNVESVISIQHNQTFPGNDRFFRGTPRNEIAKRLREQYESWAMDNINNFGIIGKYHSHRLNAMQDGTAAAAVHFKSIKEKKAVYKEPEFATEIKAFLKELVTGKESKVKNKVTFEEKITLEGTDFEPLNFNDWRVDPSADCLDDSPFLRRYYEPVWEIKKEYGLKEVESYHDYLKSSHDVTKKAQQGIVASIGTKEDAGKDKALLMVRYDDFVIDGKVYENHVAIVLNDTKLVWFGENPYNHGRKPFVITPYHKIPGSLYGKSGVRDAKSPAHALDTAVSQLIALMQWMAKPVFTKDYSKATELGLKNDDMPEPGQLVPKGIFEQMPLNLSGAMNLVPLIQMLLQSIEDMIGASAAITGQDPSQGKGNITAFQVNTHVQGAMNRYSLPMSDFNNTALKQYFIMKYENDKQYLENDYLVPGFEDMLTPEDIQLMDMDWIITASQASMQRQQQINFHLEFLNMLPQLVQSGVVIPDGKLYQASPGDIVRRILQLSGCQDTDELLKLVQSPQEQTQGGMNGGSSGLGLPSDAGIGGASPIQAATGISPDQTYAA